MECVADLQRPVEQRPQWNRMFADAVAKRVPFQQLHGDEGTALIVVNLVDGADVGMIECGSCARLALEPLQRARVAHRSVGKKLQGNQTAEANVLSFIDHTHTAGTKLLVNAIVRDNLVVHWPATPAGPR